MSEDRFKATFKVQYDGDGYIELSTKVGVAGPSLVLACVLPVYYS